MTKRASELTFISRIKRDGSGVVPVNEDVAKELRTQDMEFEMYRLSIRLGTYIARGFFCYVVKINN